jgi:hypothetical protein
VRGTVSGVAALKLETGEFDTALKLWAHPLVVMLCCGVKERPASVGCGQQRSPVLDLFARR